MHNKIPPTKFIPATELRKLLKNDDINANMENPAVGNFQLAGNSPTLEKKSIFQSLFSSFLPKKSTTSTLSPPTHAANVIKFYE